MLFPKTDVNEKSVGYEYPQQVLIKHGSRIIVTLLSKDGSKDREQIEIFAKKQDRFLG